MQQKNCITLNENPHSVAIPTSSTTPYSTEDIVRINQQCKESSPLSCVFIASEIEIRHETIKTYRAMVPRDENSNPESFDSKIEELMNLEDYHVYELVDRPNDHKRF